MAATDPVEGLSDPSGEQKSKDEDRFAKTLGNVAVCRLTYDEVTCKITPE